MQKIKELFQAILYFRNLEYTTQRWGAFQLLISVAFFLFGVALAIRLTYVEGGAVSTGFAILLFILGLVAFVFAMYIGMRFVRTAAKDVLNPHATRNDLLALRDSINKLTSTIAELPEAIVTKLSQRGRKV